MKSSSPLPILVMWPCQKNGLSFLWLNSILSTWTCIDRDPMGRGRHSSPRSCRGGLCALARLRFSQTQRGRWWERDVSGKAIERLSPPSDGMRLGFFSLSFSRREKEHKRLLSRFAGPVSPLKHRCSPPSSDAANFRVAVGQDAG